MTEYGRGSSPEPWHPEDPLYGDQGWGGQTPAGQDSYGQYYQQPQPQQPQYNGQQQYGYPQHDYNGGWDTGQHPVHDAYGAQASYGAQPSYGTQASYGAQDPYGSHDPYGAQPSGYGGERPDPYGTPEAYPPPRPPGRRHEVEPETPEWDPGPDQGEHAFFSNRDDDDDFDDDGDDGGSGRGGRGRGERRGRGGKKRRSGCACLVLSLLFAGGAGGVAYFGYQFYQDRFGAAEDYAGDGSGQVTVDIPKGASGYDIGNKLKEAGVVKSVDAFVAAQGKDAEGQSIQAGVYLMKKGMSAEAAVDLMLDPKSRNNLVIAEGMRNTTVYKAIDKRLGEPKGTTEKYAKKNWKKLGLPKWATSDHPDVKDHLEGFLAPSSYPVGKGMKPGDVLKEMVAHSTSRYESLNLESKAEAMDLDDPLQLVTVASLVQAEGKYKHDFEKVATVVYNRLKPNNTETYGLLDFDSTVNYLRGKTDLATGSVDELRRLNDPYNTYKIKGLPPGPIGNPGADALESAIKPAKGDWYYFVSVNADTTLFAETNEEHERNRQKYRDEQNGND